jgi:SET domain-containing protein
VNDILSSIEKESYVYLKPSGVCNGVGVFALRTIPTQTVLFSDVVPDVNFLSWNQLKNIHPSVIKYLHSICNTTKEGVYLSRTINNINLSYYVNHSDNPNTVHDRKIDKFITLRVIEEGEEILCQYDLEEKDWIDGLP